MKSDKTNKKCKRFQLLEKIDLMGKVFINGPGDKDSIPS